MSCDRLRGDIIVAVKAVASLSILTRMNALRAVGDSAREGDRRAASMSIKLHLEGVAVTRAHYLAVIYNEVISINSTSFQKI